MFTYLQIYTYTYITIICSLMPIISFSFFLFLFYKRTMSSDFFKKFSSLDQKHYAFCRV